MLLWTRLRLPLPLPLPLLLWPLLTAGLLQPLSAPAAAAFAQNGVRVWRAPRIEWPTSPQEQTFASGRRVLLACRATASDPFDYRWFVDGRPLAGDALLDARALLRANGSLELSAGREGEFVCVAANAWGASVSAPIRLRAERFEPPPVDPAPVAVVADSDRPLVLNCSGFEHVVPQPEVFWALERQFGGQPELEYLLLDGQHLLVDGASRLVFVSPSRADQTAAGEHYACVMRSRGSHASGLAVLQRYSLAVADAEPDERAADSEASAARANHSTNVAKVVTAVKGSALCLQCVVFGGASGAHTAVQWFHRPRGSASARLVWPRGAQAATYANELMLRKRSSEAAAARDTDPFLARVSTELERSGAQLIALEEVRVVSECSSSAVAQSALPVVSVSS